MLDYATIGTFKEANLNLVGVTVIIFEFSKLEFTDSTGIGAILDVIYLAGEQQIRVEFRGLGKDIESIFDTMGVFQILRTLQGEV